MPPVARKQYRYKNTIADALHCLRQTSQYTTAIIDFDHTLFLANSTEEYLKSLFPRPIGRLFVAVLNRLQPWNWLPGDFRSEAARDWLRVVLATVLFPWTLITWRWRAKQLARTHINSVLLSALQRSQARVTIATLGFDWIVQPLLREVPLQINCEIACRFWWGAADRLKGKCALVEERLGTSELSNAIAITDSTDDLPLLDRVSQPFLIQWPHA
jgi:phosphoserine phosphatase